MIYQKRYSVPLCTYECTLNICLRVSSPTCWSNIRFTIEIKHEAMTRTSSGVSHIMISLVMNVSRINNSSLDSSDNFFLLEAMRFHGHTSTSGRWVTGTSSLIRPR